MRPAMVGSSSILQAGAGRPKVVQWELTEHIALGWGDGVMRWMETIH